MVSSVIEYLTNPSHGMTIFLKKHANNIPNSKLKWRRRWTTTTTTTTQIIYTRSPKWMTMLFIMLNDVYHQMVGKRGKEKSTPQLGQKKQKKGNESVEMK